MAPSSGASRVRYMRRAGAVTLRPGDRLTGVNPSPGPVEMSCRDLVELVTDYLDDALPAGERARFEAHLAECDGCLSHLRQVNETIRAVGDLREANVPSDVLDALVRAFGDLRR
jgi:Putative zinc-finger